MTYSVSEDLSVKQLGEEVFIYNRLTSKVHTFNTTGAFLWTCIQNQLSPEDIVSELQNVYDVDPTSAQNDVTQFLHELHTNQLICSQTADA